ncbi:MAG: sigma-70 family RNA polymerase sigma factor [Gammaproteobacteria bacterium]|nr:MAG: sigma-70 family RNA polymerase sigma factor [Gammaproteobacteria bacterium]
MLAESVMGEVSETAEAPSEVTLLLQRTAAGDASARDPLYRVLYPMLMRLARSHLARAGTMSLDAPGLLHEAYLRLNEQTKLPDKNRRVFFAYASRVMRSVVIDYVRERGARKRGGDLAPVTLSANQPDSIFVDNSVGDVERALHALEVVDERAFRVVEMRYFAGLREEDVADVLEVSLPTVKRDWRKARAFLYQQLR